MTVIGQGLTLSGWHLNTSLVAVALHSTMPPECPGLQITAAALQMPVLYVHTQGYGHPEMTAFNALRKLSSNFMDGVYGRWIQPNATLMQVDCFDNFLTLPPESILERMADFDTELLIGSEENCWPDSTQAWSGKDLRGGKYLELYESAPHVRLSNCPVPAFRFPNLGGIIGTPRAIHAMADWVLERYPRGKCMDGESTPNDQACLHRFVLEGMSRTGHAPRLDCGHIFFPLWNFFSESVFPYAHLDRAPTAQWPAVFHTNGHVTKPVNKELQKCLSQSPHDGFDFPLVLERATVEEWDPAAQNILVPLCEHLKAVVRGKEVAETMTEDGKEFRFDRGYFVWQ